MVTDGPYAETQEVLAGYWIVDCESFDRATEIAARLAACPGPEPSPRGPTRTCARSPSPGTTWTSDRLPDTETEDLLRTLAPQVLGAVVRRYGHFDTAEDATQEALFAAATQWPDEGIPDNPRGWLITVAARRLTDLLRSEQARQRREDTVARWPLPARLPGRRQATADGRHAHPAVHVLPPLAVACLADRAHTPRHRRPDHSGDRPRIPRPGGDDDPAHHAGQAGHQGQRHPLRMPAGPERAERLGACSTCST